MGHGDSSERMVIQKMTSFILGGLIAIGMVLTMLAAVHLVQYLAAKAYELVVKHFELTTEQATNIIWTTILFLAVFIAGGIMAVGLP